MKEVKFSREECNAVKECASYAESEVDIAVDQGMIKYTDAKLFKDVLNKIGFTGKYSTTTNLAK